MSGDSRQERPVSPPPGESAAYRDGKLETGSNQERSSSSSSRNEVASSDLKKAVPKPAEKVGGETGIGSPSEGKTDKAPKNESEKGNSPKTNYEKQEQDVKDGIKKIDAEREKLAAQGKQLDAQEKELRAKLEAQEKEGKERSKEAKDALNDIAKSAQEDPKNRHIAALNDTIKSLPDKLTAQDVEDFKERARWDAAKASIGDKDFGSMTQTEKDVVLERVKKMKENATPNPESALWGAAKKTSGLSPDTKWADMSTAEQKLVQERVAEAEAKAKEKPASSSSVTPEKTPISPTPVSPKETSQDVPTTTVPAREKTPVPAPAKTPVENNSSVPASAPNQDAKKPETSTAIDRAIGFDKVQGKKYGDNIIMLDKKTSNGSNVSVYHNGDSRAINIGKGLRSDGSSVYGAAINITLKTDGSIDQILDTNNWRSITGDARNKIIEELKNIGITLPS